MKINFKYTEKPIKSKICTQCLKELPKGCPRYVAESVYTKKDSGIVHISMYMCTKCKSLSDYLESTISLYSTELSVFFLYDFSRMFLENFRHAGQTDKELFYIAKDILITFSKNYTTLKKDGRLEEINASIR